MRLLLALTLIPCALFGAFKPVVDLSNLTILTPTLADRKVSKIRLENGLEAYLISDPNAHESGAALTVDVGSLSDPEAFPGMAHFCEHMLFMGTEKYPDEKEYHRYLDEYGGNRNACTSTDRTLYMFSVNHNGFEGALSRFSEFFIAPLFNVSCADRERCAVDSEFVKNVSQDGWRVMHVQKELANKEHPFHRFCIGNALTLASVSQNQLKEWYESHYSANLMHLVVYSNLPITTMEALVDTHFSPIKNRNFKREVSKAPLFSKTAEKKLVVVAPCLDMQRLELSFELPKECLQNKEGRPDRLVSYILGHEGEKSLLETLKKERLAMGLGTDTSLLIDNQSIFTISIDLTTLGVKEYNRVIAICFQAINQVQTSGIPEFLFNEMCQMGNIRYTYQERSDIFDYVTEIAFLLPDEPLETFPKYSIAPSKYDEKAVNTLLQALNPDNCFFTLLAKPELLEIKMDKKEKWMGVEYAVLPLSINSIAKETIALPNPNTFIPNNLKVRTAETTSPVIGLLPKPRLLVENERAKIYFASDDRYLVPEIAYLIRLKTPEISDANPHSKVLADLFCSNVSEKLNTLAYNAKLGGLTYTLTPGENGLELRLNGYSEKANDFLGAILDEISRCKPTVEEFNLFKEELTRDYFNASQKTPLVEAQEELFTILYKDYAGPSIKKELIASISYEEFLAFTERVFKQNYIEGTLFGNVSEQEASQASAILEKKMGREPYPKAQHFKHLLGSFEGTQAPFYLSKKSKLAENALILTLDADAFSFKRAAALDILTKGLEEPFFSELRTKQQTAYLIRNAIKELERHHYLFFLIQSCSHDTRDLLSRFELFLESTVQNFSAIDFTPERFELLKTSLVTNMKHVAENLETAGTLLHKLAFAYDADFNWYEEKVEAIQNLSYDDFVNISREVLGKQNKKRIAVCINGKLNPNALLYKKVNSSKNIRKNISYKTKEENVCACHNYSSGQ